MLKSSLIIFFILNVISKNIQVLTGILIIEIILNIFLNKKLLENIKKLKFLIFIYITTFIAQIYYNQEGEILFKVFNVYVTKGGILNFASNFLRIINLVVLSWLINTKKMIPKRLSEYQEVIEDVIDLIPQVFTIFRNRKKAKWFFRHILSQIKIKN